MNIIYLFLLLLVVSLASSLFLNARNTKNFDRHFSKAQVAKYSDVYDSFLIKVGNFQIVSIDSEVSESSEGNENKNNFIFLTDLKSGWGNGAHPTTKLCLDFVSSSVKRGMTVLDYGTGSGILSILAAKLGALKCIAVDVDEDCIRAATNNARLNNVDKIIDIVHTKAVYIGDDSFPEADITVANILPGPLSRLVAPIWMLTKPGGLVCLSGLRPAELTAIRRIYGPYMNLQTEDTQLESHDLYGIISILVLLEHLF
jgi:ribosomal protein L11 methyltransferase